MYLEVQFECRANLSLASTVEGEQPKQSIVNMGANISKVWSDTDSLLSLADVEKAVRQGILNKNVPVTENYVEEDPSYADDLEIVNNEDIVMTSLNSPRQENVETVMENGVQQEMLNDSPDISSDSLSDDHDDITDDIDHEFTYREILIITLSSSILIVIALIIAILSYMHRRHAKNLPAHQPDLIPMSGSGGASNASVESSYQVSNSPDTDNINNDHIADFNNKFRYVSCKCLLKKTSH